MDSPDLRRSMGEFARRRIESDLAWQYSIPQLLSVYSRFGASKMEARRSNRAVGA